MPASCHDVRTPDVYDDGRAGRGLMMSEDCNVYLLTGLEGLEVIFAILVIFCRNLGQSKHPDLLMRGEICNPGWNIIPLLYS